MVMKQDSKKLKKFLVKCNDETQIFKRQSDLQPNNKSQDLTFPKDTQDQIPYTFQISAGADLPWSGPTLVTSFKGKTDR